MKFSRQTQFGKGRSEAWHLLKQIQQRHGCRADALLRERLALCAPRARRAEKRCKKCGVGHVEPTPSLLLWGAGPTVATRQRPRVHLSPAGTCDSLRSLFSKASPI
ncbi:hypothetical protein J6590_039427 [Homalodisca vitripennis]|nr:hypothetical protein J6590_039427 [Homalodisca vitripennis]